MIDLGTGDFWDRLADPTAAPGGGSAAATVAGMAAALVAKAARRSTDTWDEARGVAAQAARLATRCADLVDADARAFAAAVEALDRGQEVARRLDAAVDVLLALGEAAADVAALAEQTTRRCEGIFRGDAAAAALLAEAAARTADALVEGTLTVVEGDRRLLRSRRSAEAAAAAARRALEVEP